MKDNRKINKPTRTRSQRSRPTIGLLTRGVSNEIGASFWAGVAGVAREHNANLITFAGGSLRFPHGFEAQGNVLYDLVDAEIIDGLVLDGGDLGHYIGPEALQAFCERYHDLLMVSIEVPLPGIPSVLVDFYQGMRSVIAHLIEVHGYHRIAFIRGPAESLTAEERYRAYTDVLAEYGLPLNKNLVVSGTFHAPSGEEAVRLLLDERRIQFEALAAANDFMAVDAMQALQARGIRVPDDVAVVGFDDLDMARVVTPPLTTARLHNYERARWGAEMLLAQLGGDKVPGQTIIPAELVVRQSCGCLSPALVQAAAGPVMALDESFETALAVRREELLSAMVRAAGSSTGGVDRGRMEQLLETFTTEIGNGPSGTFLSTLDQILRQVTIAGRDIEAWNEALSVLRRYALSYLGNDEPRSQAEDLWHQARVMIGETAQRAQAYRRLRTGQYVETLHEVGQALITTLGIEELMEVIAQELPRLGILSCYLSLYENPAAPAGWSRLVLAYDETDRLELEAGGRRFPSRQLVPAGMLRRDGGHTMVAAPLYFREDQLGFILFEVDSKETMFLETLRGQISSALKGTLLLQERKRAEKALGKAYAEVEKQVEERTAELIREIAGRKRVEAMREELIAELEAKNAELERFTYTVSHDLKSPLVTIRGFLGLLEKDAAKNDTARMQGDIGRIRNATEKMEQLLEDLLELSRIGRLVNPPEAIPLSKLAREAVEQVTGQIIQRGVQVEINSNLPVVWGDRPRLLEVLQNLLDNAVKFMGDQPEPRIKIGTKQIEGETVCYVRDNGVGIEPRYHDKVFGLFQRLDQTIKGTGIGLALVKRIVEVHGGRIWVESEGKGQGCTFYFTLPLPP